MTATVAADPPIAEEATPAILIMSTTSSTSTAVPLSTVSQHATSITISTTAHAESSSTLAAENVTSPALPSPSVTTTQAEVAKRTVEPVRRRTLVSATASSLSLSSSPQPSRKAPNTQHRIHSFTKTPEINQEEHPRRKGEGSGRPKVTYLHLTCGPLSVQLYPMLEDFLVRLEPFAQATATASVFQQVQPLKHHIHNCKAGSSELTVVDVNLRDHGR